jgi:hypothetical protein
MANPNRGGSRLPASSQEAGDKFPQHVLIVTSAGSPVDAFGGSGGTANADGSTHTVDVSPGTPAQGVYESTPSTLANNELGTIGVTANREVKVSVTSGGTAGTQYTEGDVDSTITGTALLFEGAANALVAAPGTAANGLDVDVTRVSGTVTVDGSGVTQPISHAALSELASAIDTEVQVDIVAALPAGTNNIGDVDVLTLPTLPSGDNNIGNVDILTIAAGDNNIGNVDIVSLPALVAGTANIGDVDVLTLPALPAGTNNIGDVDVLTLPALPAGNNNIGDVDIASGTLTSVGTVTTVSTVTDVTTVATIGTSVTPGTSAAHLGKAVDAVAGAADTGVALLAVRDDALATLTPADGDYTHLRVSYTGALHVTGGGGGTQYVEDVAHTTGDTGTMLLAVRRDANTTLVDTTGDYAPLQVDANGALKVSGSAGTTQYAEDSAHVSGDSGVLSLGVRSDAGAAFGADGDYVPFSMDSSGALRVTGGGGGTQYTEADTDASFTGTMMLMEGAANAAVPVQGTAADGVLVNLGGNNDVTVTGTVTVGSHAVTNAGTFVVQENGAALTALQLIDNLPNTIGSTTSGQSGALNLGAVTTAAPSYTTAQTHPLSLQTDGSLRAAVTNSITVGTLPALVAGSANIGDVDVLTLPALVAGTANIGDVDVLTLPSIPAGTNNIGDVDILTIAAGDNNIGNVDIVTMPNVTLAAGTNTNEVVGDIAHGTAVGGNPVQIGFEGRSSEPTAVDSGDVTRGLATLLGKQVTTPHAIPASTWSYAAAAGGLVTTSGVTAKAAAGSGIRNYVTSAQVVNSHQTISTEVLIRDGASGTVLHRGWAQAAGGGFACEFVPPLRGTANTLIEIAEVTTTATAGVLVNLQGYVAGE